MKNGNSSPNKFFQVSLSSCRNEFIGFNWLIFFIYRSDIATSTVTIKAPVGDLMRGTNTTESEFTAEQKKLTGMTENSTTFDISSKINSDDNRLNQVILESANLNRSPSPVVTDGKTLR